MDFLLIEVPSNGGTVNREAFNIGPSAPLGSRVFDNP
jgi:hypothetical protein